MSVKVLGKTVFAVLMAVLLVGCSADGGIGALNLPLGGTSGGHAPRSIRMANRQINVTGPEGYCIDKATKRATGSGEFVLLGTCAAISGNAEDAAPRLYAILSVSVLEIQDRVSAAPQALHAYFQSDDGRAALAQSGDVTDVRLVQAQVEDGALILQAVDTSGARSDQLSDTYWRGMFPANGHLVSLTVSALGVYPISQNEGYALMRDFVKSMQTANPG